MDFIDLKSQYKMIESDINKRIKTVLEHGKFILGPEVSELEKKLAEYVGTKHCISCSSGTDALLLPLMAYGIGKGDAIFTSPFTFIATAEVIALLGATPVFVDIDPRTFNMDPDKLRKTIKELKNGKKISQGTPNNLCAKGIIPVDIFGLPADYDSINSIAKEEGLFVLEDAAQSFGGSYKGRKTCSLADVASTSFFPAKPLGCYGDGGAIFTNNAKLASVMDSLRVHGKGSDKYDNIRIGINGRLDTIQAAILLSKLKIFDDEIQKRQLIAGSYSKDLAGKAETPFVPDGYVSAWAQYSILSDKKNQSIVKLNEAGIPTMVYYQTPLHQQTAFAYLCYEKGSMPVSEKTSEKIFSLPMHGYLSEIQQKEIISRL